MTAGLLAATGSTAAAAAPSTLYVSPKGKDANKCSLKAPCKTISHAVLKAKKGDTIRVARGTYAEGVSIGKDISVVGVGRPVVNAKGQANGFKIAGSHAAGASLRGFVVKNATFEGILAEGTSHVTIAGNTVRANDQGLKAAKPTGECAPFGGGPGDCGEGIHLSGVTDSHFTGNLLTGNAGGFLLTDEAGPTARNVISGNTARGNVLDCGITLAGHSPKAVANGKRQPKVAGIYANTISKNVVNGNGTKGEGGGILMAAGAPGSAVYNNLVEGNTANDNGLAGVVIHSHSPGQDLNGNRVIGNKLSNDGLNDKSEAEFGGADFAKNTTVGILLGSGVAKLTGIVVTGNTISNAHFGIYTKNAPKVSAKANKFHKVAVAVKQV